MERRKITPDLAQFPSVFHPLLRHDTYDSSCSSAARVFFVDTDGGYYLKTAKKGTLQREAEMTRLFHRHHLAAEVLSYESLEADWLLTRALPGEDCLDSLYRSDPKRLSALLGQLLRQLHDTPICEPAVPNRSEEVLHTAKAHYLAKQYDESLFPDNWGYACPEDAWQVIASRGWQLNSEVLLHGDYCMPNILLNNWDFSGFIDLDAAGMGDRHMDLFWGIWSLQFNLKTDQYRDRFLDAYGRDVFEEEKLQLIAAIEVFL